MKPLTPEPRAKPLRKELSKKTRFEVLKRDSFTCQYCGAKAPDVLLQVDHINPVAGGGGNEILNLVTSCQPCNGGKGARPLDGSAVLAKQSVQIAELQARREQIDMLMAWKKELSNLGDYEVERVAEYFSEIVPGWSLNDFGKGEIKKLVRKCGLALVIEAVDVAAEEYLDVVDGKATDKSSQLILDYIPRVARTRKAQVEKPHLKDIFYIRAIMANRYYYCDRPRARETLEAAYDAGATIEALKSIAVESSNWSEWRSRTEDLIDALRAAQ